MTTLTRLEWLLLAAGLLLFPLSPFGAEPQATFERLDRNRDGSLSREELATEAARALNWIAVDRNGDGRITRDEFSTVLASPAKPAAGGAAAGGSAQERPERPAAKPQP